MDAFVIILFICVVFDILAIYWGADSTDGLDSSEWERRQHWYGFY